MSKIKITNGELIDSMSLYDIINHEQFMYISLFKGFVEGQTDYWHIIFESNTMTESGKWMSIWNKEIPGKRYSFYKLKESQNEPLVITHTAQEIIDAIKEKYVQEFEKLDDRSYFMAGFVNEVLNELFKIK